MRICWIHPTSKVDTLEPLWGKLEDAVRPVLRSDTTIEHRFLQRSGNFTRSLYAEHLNSVHLLEAAIRAQEDGFDGVYFGCWNDPLWEAREVLSIPVASVGEQSMLASLPMGRRFGVVTVSEKTAHAIESDLLAYGLRERAIVRPVRAIAPESDGGLLLESVTNPHARFIPRLEKIATQMIEDGAECLLVGCAYYGPLLRAAGYNEIPGTGVLVIDSTTISLKYLEAMVDISTKMGVVKSTKRSLQPPPQDALTRTRQSLNLI